ncbi:MAG: hypothetical protein JSV00_01725 [bacterium]|nr:MAG: hypothetical protein JSV00_01725 [bacterium]
MCPETRNPWQISDFFEGGFQLMAKPAGSRCDLACSYCFYRVRRGSPAQKDRFSDELLRTYIREYIRYQPTEEVVFVWQGGEPTLAGLEM